MTPPRSRPPGTGRTRPEGTITRGTTNPNRLRRVDRWAVHLLEPVLRRASDRLVVDLGYGASGVTPRELHDRLRAAYPRVRTLGLEIHPDRVAGALPWATAGLDFRLGGFEIPVDRAPAGTVPGERPVLVRAANVLRQYDEEEVRRSWARMAARLAPDGFLVEGTCDEIGRKQVFVTIRPAYATVHRGLAERRGAAVSLRTVDDPPPVEPMTLTISVDTEVLERPSAVADRLPKALIHRNVPGERIYAYLQELDRHWDLAAGLAAFSGRQRWIAMASSAHAAGVPVVRSPARWRLGEITVPWDHVRPHD
ncbi:class I SAM-dependent methyltransferase [Brevibacterium litoralis]|uniref:class I SAM-dependent methyltransferase n=1 Tax=Brevibacterium litoralis TaxID=3138935 RepID=UPI0032EE5E73